MSAEPVHNTWSITDNDAVNYLERIPGRYTKPGGYTVDEFFTLDLPPHTELIDGELVVVSPQRLFHMEVVRLLEDALRKAAPQDLVVIREMNVVLGDSQAPEPDLMLVPVDALGGLDDTRYPAEVVLLAVEVESPDSKKRDRLRKPELCAEAGLQHYWRVERQDDKPVVVVHELDPTTKAYRLTGVHHERLELSVPFGIEIDLTEIKRV